MPLLRAGLSTAVVLHESAVHKVAEKDNEASIAISWCLAVLIYPVDEQGYG